MRTRANFGSSVATENPFGLNNFNMRFKARFKPVNDPVLMDLNLKDIGAQFADLEGTKEKPGDKEEDGK